MQDAKRAYGGAKYMRKTRVDRVVADAPERYYDLVERRKRERETDAERKEAGDARRTHAQRPSSAMSPAPRIMQPMAYASFAFEPCSMSELNRNSWAIS